jgi:hypothetical protein
MQKVNLAEKLAQFGDHWKPKIVGELNGQLVKLVKFEGPFVWHHHDNEDELFLVVKVGFAWSSEIAMFGWKKANSWSSRVASNTGLWLKWKLTSCYSSRPRR